MGDPNPDYIFAPVCQLDAERAGWKEPCRKKAMVAAYLKRVQFKGGECEKWKAAMTHPVDSDDPKEATAMAVSYSTGHTST